MSLDNAVKAWIGDLRESYMREGTYGGEGTTDKVLFEDGQMHEDIADLLTVIPVELENGTPNLENREVESLTQSLNDNRPLSDHQVGIFKRLMEKYGPAVRKLRESPDHDGQDHFAKEDPAAARLVESAGPLLDLGPGVPRTSPHPRERAMSRMREAQGLRMGRLDDLHIAEVDQLAAETLLGESASAEAKQLRENIGRWDAAQAERDRETEAEDETGGGLIDLGGEGIPTRSAA